MKGLNLSKREQILAGCAAVFLLLTVVGYFHPFSGEDDSQSLAWSEMPKKSGEPAEKAPEKTKESEEKPKQMVIDVKGAVKSPGVYQMQEGDRVIDVIQKAGGFLEKADRKRINLAKLLQDEMVVYVPKEGEKGGGMKGLMGGSDSSGGKIRINTASEKELDKLPGVGPATAKAIIAYRKKHGPFEKMEDLLKVSGIGDSTLQKIQEEITLQ